MKHQYWRLREKITRKKAEYEKRKELRRIVRANARIHIYRCDSVNIGDRYSGPGLYFPELQSSATIDIFRINSQINLRNKIIILGGGGLLNDQFFGDRLKLIIESKPRALVGWGIGYNSDVSSEQWKPSFLEKFALLGLRDIDTPYEWVPCASCMHSAFDGNYSAPHSLVLYNHWEHPVTLPFAAPELRNNNQSFEKTIEFLASGETVITTSYHGAYWATLLGRKVIVVNPFSWKFKTLKHPPVIAATSQLDRALENARSYSTALGECRNANRDFAEKVRKLLAADPR